MTNRIKERKERKMINKFISFFFLLMEEIVALLNFIYKFIQYNQIELLSTKNAVL